MLIGWREWLALPALNVDRIKAKVDTGARTSALHAEQVTYVRRRGQTIVQFVVSSGRDSTNPHAVVQAPLLDERRVRSSNGKEELRPVIETVVRLGTQEWSIEVTLTRRDQMGFPMLLGRQALKGHAVVDPGRSFLNAKKIVKAIKPPEE